MNVRLRLLLLLSLLLLTAGASAQSSSSMVVGFEEERLRCSGGGKLEWQVGDSVVVKRGGAVVGWGEVLEIGEYQTWISADTFEAKVGDRVEKAAAPTASEQVLTRRVSFKAEVEGSSGGGGGIGNGLFNVFGLYNLIDNQRFARRYGDSYYRSSADVDLAIGVASLLFNSFRSRGPRSRPAEAEFEISLNQAYQEMEAAALEVGLTITNTGYHELKFDKLGEHMFLEDKNGERIEYLEMSTELLEALEPGQSVQGVVRFPPAELGSRIRFRFEDVLGESHTVKF